MIAPAAAGALHIFGYGSLVWRHDELRHTSVVPARAHGWVRRFWQQSPDHRGTPAAPGRVVTLVPSADDAAVVHGALFTVAPQDAADVLALLRHRERAGYVEQLIEVQPLPQAPPQVSGGCTVRALVFYATPSNEHWAGPSASTEACAAAADEAAAAAIAVARGESGENIDYLTQLLHAMRARGIADEHLEALFVRASALRAVGLPPPPPP